MEMGREEHGPVGKKCLKELEKIQDIQDIQDKPSDLADSGHIPRKFLSWLLS